MTKKIETYAAARQKGILLNANECTDNLSSEIIQEIQQAIPSIAFNRYPDNDETDIRKAYADVLHIDSDMVLAGNGSDQMLGLMIGTFLGKGKVLYTYDPDFSMYDYYASSYEAEVEKFQLNADGTLDIPAFIQRGKDVHASLVVFSNPNNPTGNCLNSEEIQEILKGFKDIPVIVDEAYIEFSDKESSIALLSQYDNLYVTRTLSKAYALAGIRLGFLISSKKNMDAIRPLAVPYALNSVTMKIGEIVLSHYDEVMEHVHHVKDMRNALYEETKKFQSLHFWPSQGNFLHGCCDHKDRLLELFAEKNIVIRDYKNSNAFRISIGNEEENSLVLSVLKKYEEEFS